MGTRAASGALALAACALTLAACGGGDDGTIPREQGDALISQLGAIDEAVGSGDCERAQELALEFAENVSALGEDVDPEVRDDLVDAGANLSDLSGQSDQCEQAETGATGETDQVGETAPPPIEVAPEPEAEPEEEPEEEEPDPEEPDRGPPIEVPGGGGPEGAGGGDDDNGSGGIGGGDR